LFHFMGGSVRYRVGVVEQARGPSPTGLLWSELPVGSKTTGGPLGVAKPSALPSATTVDRARNDRGDKLLKSLIVSSDEARQQKMGWATHRS
jgi:hypothetical protein